MKITMQRNAFLSISTRLGATLVLLAGLLSSVSVTPAYATAVVSNTNDTGSGSLRTAILSGGTVTFAAGLSGQTIQLASVLTLSTNVTIDGSALASPIIISGDSNNDGTGEVQVFHVNSGVTASLIGLTITRGMTPSTGHNGGGILNDGTLTVTNCSLLNNTAKYNNTTTNNYAYGGGIYNGGTLTVTGSTFTANTAIVYGGLYHAYGGAIYNYTYGTVSVTSSTFSSNLATNGGGIKSDGTLTVAGSTFSGNNRAGVWNGTWASGITSTVSVTNSTFSGNYSSGLKNDSSGAVSNSTFSTNSNSDGWGGGIANQGTLTVTNSTFSANTASVSDGGGIYNKFGTLTVTNSTFSGNTTASHGGGIYNDGTLNYANSILANSPAGSDCYNDTAGTIGINTNNLVETESGCGTPS